MIVPVDVLRAAPLAELTALDALIARHDSPLALERFRQLKAPPDAVLPWLRQKAEAGHPPFQNELAIRLLDTDLTESLKWYARGHLARILDAAECDLPGVSMFPDPGLERVRLAGVANPELMLKASEDALAWAVSGESSQPSTWICRRGEWHERKAKRQQARREMELATTRLRRYVESIEEGKRFGATFHDAEAAISNGSTTAWLDDERLLYISIERAGVAHGAPGILALFIWHVGKGTPQRLFADVLGRAKDLCVRDGNLLVVAHSENGESYDLWEGSPERIRRTYASRPASEVYERFDDCRQQWFETFANEGSRKTALRNGGGYIVTKPTATAAELISNNGTKVLLPIAAFGGRVLDYASWSGAYLVGGPDISTLREQRGSRYAEGSDVKLFSIWPVGRFQQHVIPYGLWDTMADQSTLYRLTRLGVVHSDGPLDEDNVDGWNGVFLHLFERRTTIRLTPGRHSIHATSPNGCRITLTPAVSRNGRPWRYVRVVDIC